MNGVWYARAMRILAFSDVHADLGACRHIVAWSSRSDVVVGAGDFATHADERLGETMCALEGLEAPLVCVPGNAERPDSLRAAAGGIACAHVLHGEGVRIGKHDFFGLGGAVPPTPFEESYDLTEDEAEALLRPCPRDAILITHSPAYGHLDGRSGHYGSLAILRASIRTSPLLVISGHLHVCHGGVSQLFHAGGRATLFVNPGPLGMIIDLERREVSRITDDVRPDALDLGMVERSNGGDRYDPT